MDDFIGDETLLGLLAVFHPSRRLSLLWAVASLHSIAVKIPADGRFVNLDYLNNLIMAVYSFHQRLNLVSLFI